ncbi:gamma-glutamylcyclotransferase family protein [Ornithinibacillus californiensis]|uniref:gamma-glutamylcyclotransferase family protein n=1 Tax=Ornithinibacillus californiensis TaxID=161536 RepID=UPI00064D9FCA|nr:gamma-glutamylcyclotransferase family protein [Ornithinibacillus californiensis]
MIRVFVYGTLRKGERNAHLLNNATCISESCWTQGGLYDTGNGYPAIKQSTSSIVYGEVYEVSNQELIELDYLEGYTEGRENNLYDRVDQEIITENGRIKAFVYVAARENLLKTRIASGDWLKYLVER